MTSDVLLETLDQTDPNLQLPLPFFGPTTEVKDRMKYKIAERIDCYL